MYLEEGRTIRSLSDEYEVSEASISNWVKEYREECQKDHITKEEYDYMLENKKLRRQLEEQEKEIRFLKKQRHSLRRKSLSGLSIYSSQSSRVRPAMASAEIQYLPERLLQLFAASQEGLPDSKGGNLR